MKEITNYLLANKRTTLTGVIIFTILVLYAMGYIDKEKSEYIILTLAGFGFIFSRDAV
jgi:hypothetical protein